MQSKNSITVAILAKDEAQTIGAALASARFAEAIVVGIDKTTTDDTEKVVRELQDPRIRIISSDVSGGFSQAKNELIAAVTTNWCLILDADETVTPKLATELAGIATGTSAHSAYIIPFETKLLGRTMRHGGWDEEHMRFIRPDRCRYSDKSVHEALEIEGSTGRTRGEIIHDTHRTIEALMRKVDLYSTLEAQDIFRTYHKRIGRGKLLREGARHFVARYIVRQGWRDGTEGFIEAVAQAFSIFLQWAKARELQLTEKREHGHR